MMKWSIKTRYAGTAYCLKKLSTLFGKYLKILIDEYLMNFEIYMIFTILQYSHTLLEFFWRISLYVADDVKFRPMEGNGRKFLHIELSNTV